MARLSKELRKELADYAGFGGELWQAHPAIFVEQETNIKQFLQYSALGQHTYNMGWLARRRLLLYAECYGVDRNMNSKQLYTAIIARKEQTARIAYIQQDAMIAVARSDWSGMLKKIDSWPEVWSKVYEPDMIDRRREVVAEAAGSGAIESLKFLIEVNQDDNLVQIALERAVREKQINAINYLCDIDQQDIAPDILEEAAMVLSESADDAAGATQKAQILKCACRLYTLCIDPRRKYVPDGRPWTESICDEWARLRDLAKEAE